jgi:peptidoglycan/xylan/chitin deacetylase (PgdA/CDA1 family)
MLKRLLVLAIAMGFFVTAFLVYFHVSDAQIDHDFRLERDKFHVQGLDLTTATPPAHEPPTTTPIAAPDATLSTPAPATQTDTPTGAPSDSSPVISPLPPTSSTPGATPDQSTPPATNGSPSTLIYPGLRQLPFVMMASYSSKGLSIQMPTDTTVSPAVPATSAPPVAPAAPETNAVAPAPVPVASPTPMAAPRAGTVAASVIVLGYHQFSPPGVRSKNIYNMPQDVFDAEMKYLKDNNYHVVSLADVVRFAKGEILLPPDSVAVTIDDGYKSSIVYAGPVLKKYGFPWTYFVYPAFITVHEGKGAASWSDLTELQNEGVDIECHSMTHPFLSKHRQAWKGPMHMLTPEEYDAFLTNETVTAKAELEEHLHKTVQFFAYPFGDHDKAVEAKVVSAGFKAIFTVAGNPIHPGTNLYSMGRYVITTPVEREFVAYLHEGALGLADLNPANGAIVTDPRPIVSAVLGYAGTINPASIVAEVRDMGEVRHDFDPKTSTIRLYLPRDLIDSVVVVDVRAKDATTGQTMVASWRFNYQPTAPGAAHAPIGAPTATNRAGVAPAVPERVVNEGESNVAPEPAPATNTAPVPVRAAPVPASNAAPGAPTAP